MKRLLAATVAVLALGAPALAQHGDRDSAREIGNALAEGLRQSDRGDRDRGDRDRGDRDRGDRGWRDDGDRGGTEVADRDRGRGRDRDGDRGDRNRGDRGDWNRDRNDGGDWNRDRDRDRDRADWNNDRDRGDWNRDRDRNDRNRRDYGANNRDWDRDWDRNDRRDRDRSRDRHRYDWRATPYYGRDVSYGRRHYRARTIWVDHGVPYYYRSHFHWGVGSYYPYDYRRYVVVNFYDYYLPPPPRDCVWVRHGDGAYLVAITTGLIIGLALSDAYYY
jgi:Ni/Co efflux regulator RcnB